MEDYGELIDESEDDSDQMQDLSDGQLESVEYGTYSSPRDRGDIFTWFWKVAKLKEPFKLVKTGNLSSPEVGVHKVSVRDAFLLGKLGHTFHHETFGDFWNELGGITSATSMARKGWFMDLSISQKKVRERSRTVAEEQQRWRLFNKGKTKPTT